MMPKHSNKVNEAKCKDHGNAVKQNLNGGRKYCLSCGKEVK